MNISRVIESFKERVDSLANDWEVVSKTTDENGHGMLKLFEAKLNEVQEQNYSIIIDLHRIKRELNFDNTNSNNIFSTNCNDCYSFEKENSTSEKEFKESSVTAITASNVVNNFLKIDDDTDDELIIQSCNTVSNTECIGLECERSLEVTEENELGYFPFKNDEVLTLVEFNNENIPKDNLGIKNFELQMIETPKTIYQLYEDFEKNLKYQIKEFESKFGKGQLSKLNKIRTYQRRRALIAEIEKFSHVFRIRISESITIFENYRRARNKTVAWLYNNLGKVIGEIIIEHKTQRKKEIRKKY